MSSGSKNSLSRNFESPTFSGCVFSVPSSRSARTFECLLSLFEGTAISQGQRADSLYNYAATPVYVKDIRCCISWFLLDITHKCSAIPGNERRISPYISGRIPLTSHLYFSGKFCLLSRSTKHARSNRSATRNSARCPPRMISESGATTSVHCGGTEQTDPSSVSSSRVIPQRLHRSPTQGSCRPLSG